MAPDIKKMGFVFIACIVLWIGILLPYTVTGALITLAFGLYALFQPKNGMILLFLYFPIRPIVDEWNPALKGVGDLIIILVLIRVLYESRENWRSWFDFHWFEWGYFVFCAVGAVSAYLTGVSLTAIIFQIHAFILLYLVYYIIRRLPITKEDLTKFLWTVFLVALILCVQGLIEKISLRGALMPETWQALPLSAANRIRIYGMTGNPNALAIYLSFTFIMMMYLRKHLQGAWYWVVNCGLVLFMGVWTLTYSRGTWLGTIVVMILYLLWTRNWRFLKPFFISLVIGVLLITIPANLIVGQIEQTQYGQQKRTVQSQYDQREGSFSTRMTNTFNSTDISGSIEAGRLYFIMKGFHIYPESPVIGKGFGTYGDSATLSYGSPIYDSHGIEWRFFSDNQYIEVIVETGAIGVILFAIFLLNMLYLIGRRRNESNLAPVLGCLLLAACLAGFYYNIWENNMFTLFYFAMLGLLFNFHKKTVKTLL
ncbi:MAG TPA: O-antigen ligase family protein [Bacillales bacterium]|nr:O-antigen ligase family protein [Bacillales bacterium]